MKSRSFLLISVIICVLLVLPVLADQVFQIPENGNFHRIFIERERSDGETRVVPTRWFEIWESHEEDRDELTMIEVEYDELSSDFTTKCHYALIDGNEPALYMIDGAPHEIDAGQDLLEQLDRNNIFINAMEAVLDQPCDSNSSRCNFEIENGSIFNQTTGSVERAGGFLEINTRNQIVGYEFDIVTTRETLYHFMEIDDSGGSRSARPQGMICFDNSDPFPVNTQKDELVSQNLSSGVIVSDKTDTRDVQEYYEDALTGSSYNWRSAGHQDNVWTYLKDFGENTCEMKLAYHYQPSESRVTVTIELNPEETDVENLPTGPIAMSANNGNKTVRGELSNILAEEIDILQDEKWRVRPEFSANNGDGAFRVLRNSETNDELHIIAYQSGDIVVLNYTTRPVICGPIIDIN